MTRRIIADTNLYVSAPLFGGLPESFLDLALLRAFMLVVSPALLDELSEILSSKFVLSLQDVATIRKRL